METYNYIFTTRSEAERVLDCAIEIVNSWGSISIEELTTIIGLPDTGGYKSSHGWEKFQDVRIRPYPDDKTCWMLELPEPVSLMSKFDMDDPSDLNWIPAVAFVLVALAMLFLIMQAIRIFIN